MTSQRSSDVKDKLDILGMKERVDYTLLDVQQRGSSGSQNHKYYYLTPKSFKKCLMRAQRRPGQSTDPTKYCDYFLLLEEVYKLYSIYQKSYDDKIMSLKDDKISEQSDKIGELSDLVKNQTKKIDEQSEQIRQILGHTLEVKADNKIINTKLDTANKQLVEVKTAVGEVKQMYNGIWNAFTNLGSYVKESFDTLIGRNKAKNTARYFNLATDKSKIKFQYIVVTRIRGKTEVFIRCTNEANIYQTLYNLGRYIYDIKVVGVHDSEVNYEHKILKTIYPNLTRNKSIIFDEFDSSMLDDLVNVLRNKHTQHFGDANEFIKMIQDQDRDYMDYLSGKLKDIFSLYIRDYLVIRPRKELRMATLNDLTTIVDYTYDNTDKINELVKIHGEEETLSKLEEAQAILGKFE